MGQVLGPIVSLIRHHKLKMLLVLGFTVVFAVILFPNDDLSDWITTQLGRSGVYVQMDDLSFNLLPGPGVSASSVVIEPHGVPTIHAGALHTAVLIGKILSFRLGVQAQAEKLFRGDVDLSYAQGDKTKEGTRFDEITVHAEKISLDDLGDYLRKMNMLPVKLQGNLNLDSSLRLDHLFNEQPSATATLEIPSLAIPSQSVMVDFNGVPVAQVIPTLELGRLAMKNAKLADGLLDLPEVTVGDAKSEISGKIRGTMGLATRKMPQGVVTEMKNVDFAMDLTMDKGFIERNQKTMIGGFLMLIPANLKSDTPKGTRLAFHLKLGRPGEVPNFTPLAEKL